MVCRSSGGASMDRACIPSSSAQIMYHRARGYHGQPFGGDIVIRKQD